MKKLCIVTKDLTIEPKIGFALHVHNLAKALGKKYHVEVISFGGMITKRKAGKIADNVNVTEIPDFFSLVLGALSYKASKKPTLDYFLTISAAHSHSFKKELLKKISGAHAVIFEGCWHARILPLIPKETLIIYNANNFEYGLKCQTYTDSFTKKYLLPKIYAIEKEICLKSDYVITVSSADAEKIAEAYGLSKDKIIVNSTFGGDMPSVHYTKETASPKCAVFVGSTYFANIEAANFINDVLAKQLPDYEFHIIGEAGKYVKNPQRNVKIHGFVSKAEKERIFGKCGIAIAPIFHGSGISVKIVEYMAFGLPVLCTPLVFRGLGVPEDTVILAEAEEFAEKLRSCTPDLLERVAKKGKEFFLNYRTPEALIKDWEKVLETGKKGLPQ